MGAIRGQLVEAPPVGLGDGRHVGGLLQASFNLEARQPGRLQVGQELPGRQVLGGQQITTVAQIAGHPIHNQLIGQPAGLGTLTAIGTALAQGLTGEALAGVGDTQGPMHKHLQRHGQPPLLQLALQTLQIPQTQFPGQHHPHGPQLGRHGHPGGAGDRHLGGAMHRQGRRELGSQQRQADVLHDHRIHPGGLGRQQQLRGGGQLMAEHQHVDREEALDTAAVQPGHHLR